MNKFPKEKGSEAGFEPEESCFLHSEVLAAFRKTYQKSVGIKSKFAATFLIHFPCPHTRVSMLKTSNFEQFDFFESKNGYILTRKINPANWTQDSLSTTLNQLENVFNLIFFTVVKFIEKI